MVEVVSKQDEAVLPLEKVKDQIVQELTERKGKEVLQNWVDSFKGQNRLEINAGNNGL